MEEVQGKMVREKVNKKSGNEWGSTQEDAARQTDQIYITQYKL